MAAEQALVPVRALGWTAGLGNMLDKEYGTWFRTRRWLVHLLLWVGVINGFLLLVYFGDGPSKSGHHSWQKYSELIEVFFRVGGLFGSIGVITALQGAVVRERTMGTAAWLLTKPLARPAFVVSKLVANAVTVLLFIVVIPTVGLLIQMRLAFGPGYPPALPFLAAMGVLVVHQLFYVAFTVMLGTLFSARGAVSGTGIGFLISGNIVPNLWPPSLMLTPWGLTQFAPGMVLHGKLPFPVWMPVAGTLVLTAICVAVAVWRFELEEF